MPVHVPLRESVLSRSRLPAQDSLPATVSNGADGAVRGLRDCLRLRTRSVTAFNRGYTVCGKDYPCLTSDLIHNKHGAQRIMVAVYSGLTPAGLYEVHELGHFVVIFVHTGRSRDVLRLLTASLPAGGGCRMPYERDLADGADAVGNDGQYITEASIPSYLNTALPCPSTPDGRSSPEAFTSRGMPNSTTIG